MRKKCGILLKAFIILLDEIIIAGVIIFILWKMGVQIPFWAYVLAGIICAVAYWLLYRILVDQGKKSPAGCESMIGLKGKAITPLNPEGLVRVQGETWQAASRCGVIVEGVEVVIEDSQGLQLIVKTQTEQYDAG